MKRSRRRHTLAIWQRMLCAWIVVSASLASAEEFRLKNGTDLQGSMLVMSSLGGPAVGLAALKAVKNAAPEPHPIARVDTGWQRIHFPLQQLLPAQNLPAEKIVHFDIKPPRRPGTRLLVTSIGSMTYVEPFSDFGVRRVTIETQFKPMDVIQAITQVTPDHLMVESTNCEWKFGVATKSVPIETLDTFLKKQIDLKDPLPRFNLAILYIQAEFYPQAFSELDAIAKDFPDKKELTDRYQAELMNLFGRKILLLLRNRKNAGQHLLAESHAKKLLEQPLSGAVLNDVQQYVKNYQDTRQTIERVKLLLGDWQAKLNDSELERRLQPLRSEINDQLDIETLSRLESFLNAESDTQYEPGQRLGLAYSGWLLGAANAVPDLDQALRLWDARHHVVEYLQSDDPSVHLDRLKKLETAESLSPETILRLTRNLSPVLDSSQIQSGSVQQIDSDHGASIHYSVMLPVEYSHHHQYPLLIALRSRIHSTADAVRAWAGDERLPEHGSQRGYIVIAPEYVESSMTEYTCAASSHQSVLNCLVDARRRFSIDSDRVYLAGHGMGADAAFDIGMAHPDEFAGVLPIGGNVTKFCHKLWENASYTSWYVVGKGYDLNGNRDRTSNAVFDHILKRGPKFDFMLVEYLGRNGENMIDEIPKFFNWMDLPSHVRQPQPKQFKMRSLRKTDNRFFWATGTGLSRDYVLANFSDENSKVSPMDFDVSVAPGANSIQLNRSATDNYSLRLTPDLVDFDKQLIVKIGSTIEFQGFIKRDLGATLEELRIRGDRKRLPLAVLTPKNRVQKQVRNR